MCQLCGQFPCRPQCPNAAEPDPVCVCSACGEGIYEGYEYFDGPEGAICPSCLHEMDGMEMLEILGEALSIAERSGPIWKDG